MIIKPLPLWALLVTATLTGCANYDISSEARNSPNDMDSSDTGMGSEDDDSEWGPSSEQEDDFLALAPAQTDVFVFIANPGRSTVTRVNVFTQEVRTTEVGLDLSLIHI